MGKYRKKPVVIEAWRNGSDEPKPRWLLNAEADETVTDHHLGEGKLSIQTPEGAQRADADDWIIQGVRGELYPCKPDIFEKTYEVAE